MQLKFIIDKHHDEKTLFEILLGKSGFTLNVIGINEKLVSQLRRQDKKTAEKILKNIINERYRTLSSYLKKTQALYQKSWDEINNDFSQTVEKITGCPWKHKFYFCVISLFLQGISSWGGNKIVRTWQENPYTMRKITAHELLISHIFTIFEKDFQQKNLADKQKWALAEISAFAITGLEKRTLKFWPWISEEEKYPLRHNYSELYELQRILRPKYEKKKNFNQFLHEGIKILKS